MDRRNFLATTLLGAGGFVLSSNSYPFIRISKSPDGKKLFATTDFIDNIIINNNGSRYGKPLVRNDEYYLQNKCYMNRAQLDELHQFLSSIGVSRHQWIVDTIWNMYEDYPHGFDLLEEAAKSAHKFGIEFFAEIKPFEGGGFGPVLPHSMPLPGNAGAYKDLRGIFPRLREFVAENPSLSLKCKNGTFEYNAPVTSIRLVKGDEKPTRIKAKHLSLWTSSTNNGFVPYNGPLTFSESIETRYRFPYWRECRVLHLNDLKIPVGHRYILVRCSLADAEGDFANEKGNIIELVGNEGQILPHTLSSGQVLLSDHYDSFYQSKIMRQLVRYLRFPEVQAEIDDVKKMHGHYENYFAFDAYHTGEWTTIDKEGYIAAACGKPEFMIGVLNPVYPEVRKHWHELIQFCLDRGVDGINFRVSNHNNITDPQLYGFNSPTLETAGGENDYSQIGRANGDAYTLFLEEARELIKNSGKKVTVHLLSVLLMPDDRPLKLSSLPPNFEWQWQKWVNNIADELEFRGIFKLRPENLDTVLNILGTEVKKAGKHFYLQGDFHGRAFDRPFASTKAELELVKNLDVLDGYILYETANFTKINSNGNVEGSPELLRVL
ncbi:MAG: hypothetical protein R2757_10800 [Draconibacterium sp.]